MIIEVGKKYRHFKGGEYEVIAIGKHTETMEDMAVYRSLLDGKVWIRPLIMFQEPLDKNKYKDIEQEYRFKEIE